MNTQPNPSDEIICSNCGRPNLPEAEKCWYCQIPLSDGEKSENEEDFFPQQNQTPIADPPSEPVQESVEEIPEWLKRIREKEQEEREAEAAKDEWQQQTLFNGSKPEAEPAPLKQKESRPPVERKPEKAAPKTSPEPPKVKPQEVTIAAPDVEEQPPEEPVIDDDPDFPDEDLPEGFIKFDPKSQ